MRTVYQGLNTKNSMGLHLHYLYYCSEESMYKKYRMRIVNKGNFCDYPPFKLKNHPISKMMPNLKVTVCIKMRIYFDFTDICFSIDCRLAPKLLCVDNLYNHIQYFCCPKKAHNLMSSTFKCCQISQETHQKADQIEEGE